MKKIIISIIFIIVVLVTMVIVIISSGKVDVSLIGKEKIKINCMQKYTEQGMILKRGNRIVKRNNYEVEVLNDVDTNTLGKYNVIYKIKYHDKEYKLQREIEVVDEEKPTIEINDDTLRRDYCTKNDKNHIEYKAYDNYDGDITDKVAVLETDNLISYSVKDSSGNEDSKIVKIVYEDKPDNQFVLNGDGIVYIELNHDYIEPGASYLDGCGNQIEASIVISGNVDTKKEGEYTVTYILNEDQTLTRKVIVFERHYDPRVIYLTFDDGPGPYTESILNTLAKYNVKATFFVTNQFPAYQGLIANEYNQGHTIAVHTYSHRYELVYSSVAAYFDDFNLMNEVIHNYTGTYTNLFRFPGGSSNTISRRYAWGVVSQIANEAAARGYIYFDWNLDSRDAEGADSWSIYNNLINGVEYCTYCVVLMHDIKPATAEALDSIIAEFKMRGYTFATLDASSPTAHHRIQN